MGDFKGVFADQEKATLFPAKRQEHGCSWQVLLFRQESLNATKSRFKKCCFLNSRFYNVPYFHPEAAFLPGRLWPGVRRRKAVLFEFPSHPRAA
jgi:hypothetical protein